MRQGGLRLRRCRVVHQERARNRHPGSQTGTCGDLGAPFLMEWNAHHDADSRYSIGKKRGEHPRIVRVTVHIP